MATTVLGAKFASAIGGLLFNNVKSILNEWPFFCYTAAELAVPPFERQNPTCGPSKKQDYHSVIYIIASQQVYITVSVLASTAVTVATDSAHVTDNNNPTWKKFTSQ